MAPRSAPRAKPVDPAKLRRPTLEDYAKLGFPNEGGCLAEHLKDPDAWAENACVEHLMVQVAAATLSRDDVQTEAFVAEIGLFATREMLDTLSGMKRRYRTLGKLMTAAHIRTLAGMARIVSKAG